MFAGLESPPLDREGVRLYHSGTMRISHLGQDRADVQEGSQVSLSSHAKSNAGGSCRAQKNSAVPRAVLVVEEQKLPRELNGWV